MSQAGDEWKRRRVLVTGAAGFIGRNLCEHLIGLDSEVAPVDDYSNSQSDSSSSVCGRPIARMRVCSAEFRRLVSSFAPEVVFHLGGSSSVPASVQDPARDMRSNVVPTLMFLELLRKLRSPALFVFASSAAVYGEPSYTPMDEEHPTHPITPYGVSKLAAERYVATYSQLYGLRTLCVRMFSIYGPGQRKQVVYDLIQKLSGRNVEDLWGDGSQVRDLLYISDVVSALITVSSQGVPNGKVYNICSGEGFSIRTLEAELGLMLENPRTLSYRQACRPGDPQYWIGSLARIKSLGFRPQIQLRDGLRLTVDWVLNNAHLGPQPG